MAQGDRDGKGDKSALIFWRPACPCGGRGTVERTDEAVATTFWDEPLTCVILFAAHYISLQTYSRSSNHPPHFTQREGWGNKLKFTQWHMYETEPEFGAVKLE